MAYAAKSDLAAFIGVPEVELPEDADRLLERASELIAEVTRNRVDLGGHVEAARKAACAQVEYWLEVDESMDKTGAPDMVQIGTFRMDGKLPELAPRARRILRVAGLLTMGVRMR